MYFKAILTHGLMALVAGVGGLMTTPAQAQIAITGGQIGFIEWGGTMQLAPNDPVTGTLVTGQGTIATPAITLTGSNMPNSFNPFSGTSQTFNLVAAGTAYTPNGPVLFANVPVTIQWMPNTANTIFPNNNSVVWQNQVVIGGQFGTGASIADSRGSTISLAANNFNFDSTHSFPAPIGQPPTNSPTPGSGSPNGGTGRPAPLPIANPPQSVAELDDSYSISQPLLASFSASLPDGDQSTFTHNEGRTYRVLETGLQPSLRRDGVYSRIFPASGLYQ